MSHINATINGLATIRAAHAEDVLIKEFNSLQDRNTSTCFIFKASTRAIAFWMEWICVIYMSIAITIFLFFHMSKFNFFQKKSLNKFWTFKKNIFYYYRHIQW